MKKHMHDGTMNDVFYFIDYSRLLLEDEIRQKHHEFGYRNFLDKQLIPFWNKISMGLNNYTEIELMNLAHFVRSELCSFIKDISNHTPVMRALLRAETAIQQLYDLDNKEHDPI